MGHDKKKEMAGFLCCISSVAKEGTLRISLVENQVRTYDIFSGAKDKQPVWLEATNGRESAYERMLAIALEKPGSYFVFCTTTDGVVFAVDTMLLYRMLVQSRRRRLAPRSYVSIPVF